jgi:hypothetical protein
VLRRYRHRGIGAGSRPGYAHATSAQAGAATTRGGQRSRHNSSPGFPRASGLPDVPARERLLGLRVNGFAYVGVERSGVRAHLAIESLAFLGASQPDH